MQAKCFYISEKYNEAMVKDFMYKILEKVLKTSEAIEDYKDLKENVSKVEYSLSNPKTSYQYAEVRIKSKY